MNYYQSNTENETIDHLCCCEYINNENERFHILACCCNCVDVDECFDRFISCRRISNTTRKNMLITFQDRLRIPWRGGAKIVTLDSILPIILIVFINLIAAINMYCALLVFIAFPVILGYAYVQLIKIIPKTKFFYFWCISSGAYLFVLFEMNVPLLELLPEENCAFLLLLCISLLCYYKAYKISHLNNNAQVVKNENVNDESQTTLLISDKDESDESDSQNMCLFCRRYVTPRSYHTYIRWLNCCVGKYNHRIFLFGCAFAIATLLLYINLVATAVCHPFPIYKLFSIYILLPDDCSDVFEQYDIALSFVGTLYAAVIILYLIYVMYKQIRKSCNYSF